MMYRKNRSSWQQSSYLILFIWKYLSIIFQLWLRWQLNARSKLVYTYAICIVIIKGCIIYYFTLMHEFIALVVGRSIYYFSLFLFSPYIINSCKICRLHCNDLKLRSLQGVHNQSDFLIILWKCKHCWLLSIA